MQSLNIFISYRHQDTADGAVRLRNELKGHFGPGSNIFIDIEAIPAGTEFRERIKAGLANADVLLVLIGPRWLPKAA